MSQARGLWLRQIALYCNNHTSISPWDAVAFFASKSLPSDFPTKAGFDREVVKAIDEIKQIDPEELEGYYNWCSQEQWNNGIPTPHYYCSQVCNDL